MERLANVCFGSGGISKETYKLIEDINRVNNQQVLDFIGFVGSKKSDVSTEIIGGKRIVSCDDDIFEFAGGFPIIGMVIPIGSPKIKEEIFLKVKSVTNVVFPNIIHPSASFDRESCKIVCFRIIAANAAAISRYPNGSFAILHY